MSNKIILTAAFLTLIASCTAVVAANSQSPIVKIEPQYAADFSDDKILVGASHAVFVGQVIEQSGTKSRGNSPETQYLVNVVSTIKGDLPDTVTVNLLGGYSSEKLYVIDTGNSDKEYIESYLLKPGSTYLFATRYSAEFDWYTVSPHPSGRELMSSDSILNSEHLKIISMRHPRVLELINAYPREVLLKADLENDNALNSYQSLQEKESSSNEIDPISPEEPKENVDSPALVEPEQSTASTSPQESEKAI